MLKLKTTEEKQLPAQNSIIELARFFFAAIVVIHHSFYYNMPAKCERGYLAVEFFFILSGYLFVRQANKYKDKSFLKGLGGFTCARLKSLGFIFIVTLAFAIAYYVNWLNRGNTTHWGVYKGEFGPFGLLWYMQNLIPILIIMFVLYRLAKKQYIFLPTVAAIMIVCSVFFLPDVIWAWGWGYGGILRGFAEVSLGILLYYIPKIKIRFVAIVALAVIVPLIIWQLFLPEKAEVLYNLAFILSCAAFVYFAFQVNIRVPFINKIFCYLGSLSFALYCFQEVPLLLAQLGFKDWKVLMAILATLTLVANTEKFKKYFIKKQT
jgi:peptidoglycan/LPS O-acetylase OafA/YrhL